MREAERARDARDRAASSASTARRRRRSREAAAAVGVAVALLCVSSRAPTAGAAEAIWGLETVYDGVGYDPDNPTLVCGPSTEGSSFRATGCATPLTDRDSYGAAGDPGFSFASYAYKGKSYGPPYNDVQDVAACSYSLTYAKAAAAGLEDCFYAPDTGGVRTTEAQKLPTNLGFATLGYRLSASEWRDKLPDYVRQRYELPPLRLGFEEGTFWPNWKLLSKGLPNFAVKKTCFLEAHSGEYQLCSAYPMDRSESIHGVLRVQSISFALGRGVLMFEANGGDKDVPDITQDPYDIASHGKGVLGVALTRISDGYRVLTKAVRSRRFWDTYKWTAEELQPYYGEVFRLEILDYRSGPFGWIAVDSFVIPRAPVIITKVEPAFGSRKGGTRITITGQNFGSSVDDKTVFIGDQECTDLIMSYSRCTSANTVCAGAMSCTTPPARPGEGVNVRVSVVIGDPAVVRSASADDRGPDGKFQAAFCGAESTEHPFSECEILQTDSTSTVRKRGFTYSDAPEVKSSAPTIATQDSLYKYTIEAVDEDNDALTYTAVTLPSFLRFDPTTRQLMGTPYEADVQCRSNKWHPASERCANNATYTVEFEISDGQNVVPYKFEITVSPNTTALLVDKSFHWENAVQIFEKYKQVVTLGAVTAASDAIRNRNVSSPTEITDFHYRNPTNSEDKKRREQLVDIANDPTIDEVEVDAAIQFLRTSGTASENLDLIETLNAQVEVQKRNQISSGASAPALQGISWRGWLNYFKKLGDALGKNCAVFTNIAGLAVPPAATHMLSREKLIVIKVLTPCNTTALSVDRFVPACDLVGISQEHEIWMSFSDDGTTLEDVIISPGDFEHSDLVQSSTYTQDIPGFLTQTIRRIVAQSARLQEIMILGEKVPIWFDKTTSMLTVGLNVKSSPVSVVMQLPTSYPYPEPGKYGLPNVNVISCDHISHDYENALKNFSSLMTDETKGGSLLHRVQALNKSVIFHAEKCKNNCNQKGTCNTTSLPPTCECYGEYTGDDCSQVQCPGATDPNKGACSKQGACDAAQICVHNPETGETDCAGGTGKCACYYPFFGADCSLRQCPKSYIVYEGNSTNKISSEQIQTIKNRYEAMGLRVRDVKVSETNGDEAPSWAIKGDEYSEANKVGAVYVEFSSSEDAEKARAQESFYINSVPSRGVAIKANAFQQEYRAFIKREQQLLELFGKSNAECNAAGACAFETGKCFCANSTVGGSRGYYGAGCEFQHCVNDCAGHGLCDERTGSCLCDTFYVADSTFGCVLHDYGLISTACTDEVLDRSVHETNGTRMEPLHASCLFGTKLGSSVTAATTKFVQSITGEVALDSSGYTSEKNSKIYFYQDEPCNATQPQRTQLCDATKTAYDEIRRGIGMIPPASLTFDLRAMRAENIIFSSFRTQVGIVRQYPAAENNGGCGDCSAANPLCGAVFKITVDDVEEFNSLVNDRYPDASPRGPGGYLEIDVSTANKLTLSTEKYKPPYWRPADSSEPKDEEAVWCDGSAWGDAEFH